MERIERIGLQGEVWRERENRELQGEGLEWYKGCKEKVVDFRLAGDAGRRLKTREDRVAGRRLTG